MAWRENERSSFRVERTASLRSLLGIKRIDRMGRLEICMVCEGVG